MGNLTATLCKSIHLTSYSHHEGKGEKGNKWEGSEKAMFISLQRAVGDFFACLLYLSSCLLLNNKQVQAENLCCDIYPSY